MHKLIQISDKTLMRLSEKHIQVPEAGIERHQGGGSAEGAQDPGRLCPVDAAAGRENNRSAPGVGGQAPGGSAPADRPGAGLQGSPHNRPDGPSRPGHRGDGLGELLRERVQELGRGRPRGSRAPAREGGAPGGSGPGPGHPGPEAPKLVAGAGFGARGDPVPQAHRGLRQEPRHAPTPAAVRRGPLRERRRARGARLRSFRPRSGLRLPTPPHTAQPRLDLRGCHFSQVIY